MKGRERTRAQVLLLDAANRHDSALNGLRRVELQADEGVPAADLLPILRSAVDDLRLSHSRTLAVVGAMVGAADLMDMPNKELHPETVRMLRELAIG